MSQYQLTPFKQPPQLLVAGTPSYVYGSYDDRSSPTQGNVITDAAVTTTATLVFQIVSGNIPLVGDKITVVGTANSAGVFNVTNANVATVSTTNAGVCTVTYAIASTSQVSTADGGQVVIPRSEIGEALQNGASVPVAKVSNNALVNQGEIITVSVSFPILPKACNVFLQEATIDLDSEYTNIAIVGTVSNSVAQGSVAVQTSVEIAGRFYRLAITGLTGTGTIVGKILG
jgi:hypothetical protein